MNNYLTPVLIEDPRLTPELKRTRSGATQQFAAPGKRTFDPDFTIEAPFRHVFAELSGDKWYWVNGCDECHGREGTWSTYIKCESHDVCYSCKTPRKELKEIPWGHPKGFECKPCRSSRKAEEAAEALAKMPLWHDEWEYEGLDCVKCPHCNLVYDSDHGFYTAENTVTECDRCKRKFKVTANPIVNFTMERVSE